MRSSRTLRLVPVAGLAVLGAVSSCIDEGGGKADSGGTGGQSSGSLSNGSGDTFSAGAMVGGSGGGSCQHYDVVFTPKTPTVLLLVDRSGSMFEGGFWDPLKTALLNVVNATQSDVRYGLSTYTGVAGMCPMFTGTTDFALDAYDDVKKAYDMATQPATKSETPTAMALSQEAIPKVAAFQEAGPKFIFLVTDGEPDRCDDGDPQCPRDDVIAAVQDAYMQGIGLYVFGLGPDVYTQHLQDVANAGAGQPVLRPDNALYACFGGDWANAKGTYADAGGNAKYFTPTPTDEMALETELQATIAGVKSCNFDLGGKIQVDLSHASEGKVYIDGQPVPYDMANGWYMQTPTELVLAGEACEKLKNAMQGISFDFPCEIIEPK